LIVFVIGRFFMARTTHNAHAQADSTSKLMEEKIEINEEKSCVCECYPLLEAHHNSSLSALFGGGLSEKRDEARAQMAAARGYEQKK